MVSLSKIIYPKFKTDKDDFKDSVWSKIQRNIQFVASYGGIVELNTKAYKKGLKDPYPHSKIVKEMMKHNINYLLNWYNPKTRFSYCY